jgi:hypothetical protein
MSTHRRHPPISQQPTGRQPTTAQSPARRPLVGSALMLLMALLLASPPGRVLAANKQPTLVQPSSTGEAKAARQALLKQHALDVPRTVPRPGKTVGGTTTRPPKTIVTKRFLPK